MQNIIDNFKKEKLMTPIGVGLIIITLLMFGNLTKAVLQKKKFLSVKKELLVLSDDVIENYDVKKFNEVENHDQYVVKMLKLRSKCNDYYAVNDYGVTKMVGFEKEQLGLYCYEYLFDLAAGDLSTYSEQYDSTAKLNKMKSSIEDLRDLNYNIFQIKLRMPSQPVLTGVFVGWVLVALSIYFPSRFKKKRSDGNKDD